MSQLKAGPEMNEEVNNIRSNLIYLFYKLFIIHKNNVSVAKKYKFEKNILTWDGENTLEFHGNSHRILVQDNKVMLDDEIQHYYQIPYDWLRTLKINVTNDSYNKGINM